MMDADMMSNYDSHKYDRNRYDRISGYYNELMLNGYYNYETLTDQLSDIFCRHGCRTVLELGIGTGLVASRLIKKGSYALTGVDFSPSMIALCDHELKRRVDIHVMDVVDLELRREFDAIYCVGGVWYFIDNKDEHGADKRYQLCSHVPDVGKQLQSFRSVARHLRPDGILVLSIQGPHHDYERKLPSGVVYRQTIATDGSCFEKAYIFKRDGKLLARQDCLYRLTELDEASHLLSEAGLKLRYFDESGQYVVLAKASA